MAGLISSSNCFRMLTQPLLRESFSAISARLRLWTVSRSAMKRACSSRLNALSVEPRIRLRMPIASSSPSDT
jgi:hypothetical protein